MDNDAETNWRYIMDRCSTCVEIHNDGSIEAYAKAPLMRKFRGKNPAELREKIEAALAATTETPNGS